MDTKWERWRAASAAREPWTIRWIEQYLRPGDVLFDVGANVGAYALVAAKSSAGEVTTFAFEPGFATFAALCRNIVLNDCQASVVPMAIALGDKTSLSSFNYRVLEAGAAGHGMADRLPAPLPGEAAATQYEQPMPVFRLDDLIRSLTLPNPNHLKIDVDAMELEVLKGAERTLAHSDLRSVLIEIDNSLREEAHALLRSAGLRTKETYEVTANDGSLANYGYALFVRAP
ncbi:methyltransferase, FkbM family domain protein [Euzebya pacifica]|uniref:Methyltransferase, FkbM family domain protein n=2 Tax=Euzebya pacifica TaxID=1608957 RepID=A0A346XW14_9ACTN|nr:methyltransferase, FkbM family domain protein [Euzebya pacifica]